MFSLLRSAIQCSISPIASLLSPPLPCNALLTTSNASKIYEAVLDACKEHNWSVTAERESGGVDDDDGM